MSNGFLEPIEPHHDRAPHRQLPVGRDKERQRALNAGEGRSSLHHAAELNLLGEVGRCHQDKGKDHRRLRVAGRQRRHLFGANHDRHPIADDVVEAIEQAFPFGRFAVQQGDLLGNFAGSYQVEAEVGFVLLLAEVEADQRPADEVGQHGAEHGIDQCAPDQIAGNVVLHTEHMQWRRCRESPKDDDKGCQGHDGAEEADANRERLLDEESDVVGDTLIGVVGGIAEQLHAIVIGVMQPFGQIAARQPGSPANL